MTYLLLSIVLLLVSPFLQKATRRFHRIHQFVQILLVVGVGYYAFVHIIPAAFRNIGWAVVPAALCGYLLIWFTERFWMSTHRSAYTFFLLLAIVGILLHSMMDGAMIAFATADIRPDSYVSQTALIYLVFLHQIPVGAFIWSVAEKKFDEKIAWMIICVMGVATLLGFLASRQIAYSLLFSPEFGYFQAFVVGNLVHIGFEPFVHGKSHACDC